MSWRPDVRGEGHASPVRSHGAMTQTKNSENSTFCRCNEIIPCLRWTKTAIWYLYNNKSEIVGRRFCRRSVNIRRRKWRGDRFISRMVVLMNPKVLTGGLETCRDALQL